MSRQYVHLSENKETALRVGEPRGKKLLGLQIEALEASRQGIQFYSGNKAISSADFVPEKYIILCLRWEEG